MHLQFVFSFTIFEQHSNICMKLSYKLNNLKTNKTKLAFEFLIEICVSNYLHRLEIVNLPFLSIFERNIGCLRYFFYYLLLFILFNNFLLSC